MDLNIGALIIVAGYLIGMLIIGFVVGKIKIKTSHDYMIAGRRMGLFMVAFSLSANNIGGGSTTGLADKAFGSWGMSAIWYVLAASIAMIPLAYFAPRIRKTMAVTIPEVIGRRFGTGSSVFSAVLNILALFCLTSSQVAASGSVVHTLTGIPMNVCLILAGLVIIIYTTLGGMIADQISDLVQFIIILFGLAIGLLYGLARRLRHPIWGIALVSFVASTLHSFLVYSAMYLFFPEAGYSPMDAFSGFFSPTELLSNAVIAAVVVLLWLASRTQAWQKFQQRLAFTHALQTWTRYHRLSMVIMTALTLAASLAVTAYFVHRIDYVLEGCGIDLTGEGYMDIFHLQIQFLFGIISLMVLVILFLILNRHYNSYQAYEGKIDSLTGSMTRRAFFSSCSRALRTMERQQDTAAGYFIMVDLDDFKAINDIYGHPEGDRALKEVSHGLRELFRSDGIIGRLGGDEFAVLLYRDVPIAELEADLRHFLDRVHRVVWDGRHLTCSIGVLPVRAGSTPEELYRDADRLLYAAKERGRDQFVIGTAEAAAQNCTGNGV